jgi:hypothetical protein
MKEINMPSRTAADFARTAEHNYTREQEEEYGKKLEEIQTAARAQETKEFAEAFLAYQFNGEGETNREKLRRLGKITHEQFHHMMGEFRDLGNSKFRKQPQDHRFMVNLPIPDELIREIQKQAGMNIIRRNPWRTFVTSVVVGLGAAVLPLVGMFIFEAVTGASAMSAVLSALPFLAAFGPLGAAVGFVGLISAAALVIYGITVGITAAKTEKNIEVVESNDERQFSQHQMKGLGRDDAYSEDDQPDLQPFEADLSSRTTRDAGYAAAALDFPLPQQHGRQNLGHFNRREVQQQRFHLDATQFSSTY